MQKSLVESIFKPRRVRFQILSLAGGTTGAQFIGLAAAPILSRLFAPSAFGLFSIFLSLVSVLSVLLSFRLDSAIPLPKADNDARTVLQAAITISSVLGLIGFLGLFFTNLFTELPPWILWLFPASFLLSLMFSMGSWSNRLGYYTDTAASKIIQALLSILVPIVVAFYSNDGVILIFGAFCGYFAASTFLYFRIRLRPFFATFKSIRAVLVEYRRFPIHILPSHLIGALHFQIPVLLVAFQYSVEEAGLYGMANRLIAVPTAVLSNAIGEVFRQQASQQFSRQGNFRNLFLKTLFYSTLISALPFGLIYFLGSDIFTFVFGHNWTEAGAFASWLAIWGFFSFATGAVDKGAIIVGASRYVFYWHLSMLITNVLWAWCSVSFSLSALTYVKGLVFLKVVHHVVDVLVEWRLSLGKRKHSVTF